MTAPTFPLPRDKTDVGALIEAARSVAAQACGFGLVRAGVQSGGARAAREVEGDLVGPAMTATQSPSARAGDLMLASVAAGGTMAAYAAAVTAYNAVVDRLNEEYARAKAAQFSVAADAGATEGMSDSQRKEARSATIDAADAALRIKLGREEQAARRELDATGDQLANGLGLAPSQTIMALVGSGLLAVPLWSDLGGPALDVLRFLGLAPTAEFPGLGWPGVGVGIGIEAFSLTAASLQLRHGRFRAVALYRGKNGKWWPAWGRGRRGVHYRIVPTGKRGVLRPTQRLSWGMRPDLSWVPKAGAAPNFAKWSKIGSVGGPAGALLAGAGAGYSQWQKDASDPRYSDEDRRRRALVKGGAVGAGTFVGALIGTKVGVAAGGVIGNVPGAVIGGFVGGFAGGVAGGKGGEFVADRINESMDDKAGIR